MATLCSESLHKYHDRAREVWGVDELSVRLDGQWQYLYRAIDRGRTVESRPGARTSGGGFHAHAFACGIGPQCHPSTTQRKSSDHYPCGERA
jgi:hypothetical protein